MSLIAQIDVKNPEIKRAKGEKRSPPLANAFGVKRTQAPQYPLIRAT